MNPPRARRSRWSLLLTLVLVGCSKLKSQGEQCGFNDDCSDPLVCAATRCRAQCRTDRDCPPTYICAPSDSPTKRVCVARAEVSLCANDQSCPQGSTCASNNCWWRCASDALCASRDASTCTLPEGLCARPLSAGEQRDLPTNPLPPPDDAGVLPDVAETDATAVDASAMDAPSADAPSADAPGMDAAAADAPALDAAADVADEPALCRDDGDCYFAHASGRCASGRCALGACMAGFADCDGRPATGCETPTTSDPDHCGACDRRCNLPPNVTEVQCVAGACRRSACAVGFADCNGEPSDGCEVDTRTSTSHCGACNAACPDFAAPARGGVATACRAGVCTYTMCVAGRGDCDGDPSNGCEVDLRTTGTHCGACGMACATFAQGTVTCEGGACVRACLPHRGDCDALSANGCERDLQNDPDHCGGCGRRCAPDQRCELGTCVATAFPAGETAEVLAPTADVVLTAGVHRYASVTIPAGVTVRVGGSGVLEIYARGAVLIEGTIDLSGGAGGQGVSAGTINCTGGNGGGGSTGTTTDGTTGSAGVRSAPGGGGTGSPGGDSLQPPTGLGGRYGGAAGGVPTGVGAAGGGGGWAGGGGGGGTSGCTFCGAGDGAGATRYAGNGGNGGSGGQGAWADTSTSLYNATNGANARYGVPGGGGGGGGSIGPEAALDLSLTAATSTFRPGSGGGGGGAASGTDSMGVCTPSAGFGGGGGGGGGGALRIVSATSLEVRATGALLANGGAGGNSVSATGGASGGGGGGGSGGLIDLSAPVMTVIGTVRATGGRGGAPSNNSNTGGHGGPGRIVVSVNPAACNLGGLFEPQLVSGCTVSTGAGVPNRVYVRGTPR